MDGDNRVLSEVPLYNIKRASVLSSVCGFGDTNRIHSILHFILGLSEIEEKDVLDPNNEI